MNVAPLDMFLWRASLETRGPAELDRVQAETLPSPISSTILSMKECLEASGS
jgi:hypothetical protein